MAEEIMVQDGVEYILVKGKDSHLSKRQRKIVMDGVHRRADKLIEACEEGDVGRWRGVTRDRDGWVWTVRISRRPTAESDTSTLPCNMQVVQPACAGGMSHSLVEVDFDMHPEMSEALLERGIHRVYHCEACGRYELHLYKDAKEVTVWVDDNDWEQWGQVEGLAQA